MIDWMTLILDAEHLTPQQREQLRKQVDLVVRIDPDGQCKDILTTWTSLRSDMTGCTLAYSPNQLTLCGSPASLDQTNNVFGSDDIIECFHKFRTFIADKLGVFLPSDITKYRCTRIDITYNYFLNGQDEVENALGYLKYANTRGQNVQRKGTTVYWNKSSNRRSAKAYNKYLHAKTMLKDFKHSYSQQNLENLKNILRLELKLGSKYIGEHKHRWHEMTAEILQFEHHSFFNKTIGSVDVPTKTELFNRLLVVAPSKNQARAAFNTFSEIASIGYELTKRNMSSSTWYRHVSILKQAGLSAADVHKGEILPFRRKHITLGEPVQNWDDLQQLVGVKQ